MTTYILGGGCFWCLDAVYRRIKGVTEVESGYAGGDDPEPNYYGVASGKTGHAEVIKLTFDEAVIPADVILDIYFLIHNPTTLNKQGADEGTQYRSIMLFANNDQESEFQAAIERAQKIWDDPIVTQVERLEGYFPAEAEHQDYFNNNPTNGYCSIVIDPKISKVRSQYTDWFIEPTA